MSDEALRRSDDLLTELIETIETARALPMSTSCVLPREHLLDLLDELREVLPPEMDEARTVVARRDKLLQDAYENAASIRDRAVAQADATLADAQHRSEEMLARAQAEAAETVRAGHEEHARLVASTTVHQAAAAAAAALRQDAEQYQQQLAAEAQQYDAHVRGEADAYAAHVRGEAERYATKLTNDAEDYAERTLDELGAVLRRAAHTAEQGRSALAARRGPAGPPAEEFAVSHERDEHRERSPISA
jgi:cell division septum initiation protein DivIVA